MEYFLNKTIYRIHNNSDTVLRSLPVLTYLIFITVLSDRFYYYSDTAEVTKT